MLLLTSTSDIIRLVTGSAVSTIGVHASWADNNAGTISFGRQNTAITTATTTTIVPAPSSGVARNLKYLMISNNSASTSTTVSLQHFDGTTSIDLFDCTLLPGENLAFREDGSFAHRDANGAEYGFTLSSVDAYSMAYGITGTIAESVPRHIAGVNIASALTSGTMFMQGIYIRGGVKITNIAACSGATASATQTSRWFALYDQNRTLLRQTADQGTTAWAANTVVSLALSSTYTTTYSGLYYVGILVTATTPNTMAGVTAAGNAAIRSGAPIISGNSTTGLAATAPATAAALTASVNTYWVAVT